MLIDNYKKFQSDLKEYNLSLNFFNKIYKNLLDKILDVKKIALESMFMDSIELSRSVVMHTKYSTYSFLMIKEYVDNIVYAMEEMLVSTDIMADYTYLCKIKDSLDELLKQDRLKNIDEKRAEITNTFFSGMIDNINGYEEHFNNANILTLFFRSYDILTTLEREINKISTDGLYECYNILINECLKALDEKIYNEELQAFENVRKRITMCNSKVKFSIMNSVNFNDCEVKELAGTILDNMQKLELYLSSFLMMEMKENGDYKKLDYASFKNSYELCGTLLNSENFSCLVFGAKSSVQHFLANYKEFYDLKDDQKLLVESVNRIYYLFGRFLNKYKKETAKNKVAICEAIELKKDLIFREFDRVIDNNEDVDNYITKVCVKEISLFEELVGLTVEDIYQQDKEFARDLEKLLFEVINAMKINGVESYIPKKDEKFNSKLHVVEKVIVDEDYDIGNVISTVYNGYKKDDKVILQARVVVCSK